MERFNEDSLLPRYVAPKKSKVQRLLWLTVGQAIPKNSHGTAQSPRRRREYRRLLLDRGYEETMKSYATIVLIARPWAKTHREPSDRTNDKRPECRLRISEVSLQMAANTTCGKCLAYILMHVLGSSSSEWHGRRPRLPS